MKTDLFDFVLPERLIATQPCEPRDAARMLVVGDSLDDRRIGDLPASLRPGDVMVFNDTRVIPARLYGRRGEAKIELLLHKRRAGGTWSAFARPARRLRDGDRITFGENFSATVAGKLPGGEVLLSFPCEAGELHGLLNRHGHMPLPPYIERQRAADETDNRDYQTLYARHEGSVAAPTAGLHFTQGLLDAIDANRIIRAHVTLHVGGGTFLPVKTDDTDNHIMHAEHAVVSVEAAQAINAARAAGGRVIAVGTTSLRTLESAVDGQGMIQPFDAETAIFITPGYRFRAADVLLTNFHLPRSTLFMLVSAFSGLERMLAAYRYAMEQGYRFYSYGDACLLERAES